MLIFLYQSRQIREKMINQIIVQKIAWYEKKKCREGEKRTKRQAMIFPQRHLLG